MIAGLFLRHYKIYQGLYFIPICNDYNNKYSEFIGDNGVGKSSVLEALNTFFNNEYWNKNKFGKKDEAFIAPIFLLKKDEIEQELSYLTDVLKFIEFLSDYFWNVSSDANANLSSDEFKRFFEFRNNLKEEYGSEKYYLFILGIEYENKSKVNFITFNRDVMEKRPDELRNFEYSCLIDVMRNMYSYVYIPTQTAPSQILKIEGKELQELMNTDILNKIDLILNEKNFKDGKKAISVIDFLNNSLNEYMDSINETIKKIDDEYAFKVEGTYKKNLTSSDVRKKILEAYFSIRTLKKDKQEVEELSSGEQRIALIDIATAFLLNSDTTHKKIIFAIDEPENSLHISKAFNQFDRLESLSCKHQIMITTHWYGSLPITNKGCLQYLEKVERTKRIKLYSFDFNNYFESRRGFPEDLMIKSYFELTSSILSSMRADKTNWIICEGSDDKLYLEYYLKDIKNLKIFSIGGCGNVVKLYKYLYIPFSEKDESKYLESKILCIIDSDDELKTIELPNMTTNKKLKIVRIQNDRENKVEFKKLDGKGQYYSTEIEDCLEPKILFEALTKTIKENGSAEQISALEDFEFNKNANTARVKGEAIYTILKPKKLEALYNKIYIDKFIDDYRFKYLIAENYICIANTIGTNLKPNLFNLVEEYFNVE
ncbi:MAG: ATP-binding protein [Clostridium sp.]|uniref:AAA family ATPase n=1 Tax=Clostridium sp. TaxID=1506 RepID=UPI0025C38921|nr:AAA family ATPase [Clostridium sp.]MCE5221787.1 ATP-binding protein [Clostridium sp.]